MKMREALSLLGGSGGTPPPDFVFLQGCKIVQSGDIFFKPLFLNSRTLPGSIKEIFLLKSLLPFTFYILTLSDRIGI